ncbi:hypothetical protein [Streptomyces atratus]|uniref:hypothetical protein n=1 Tax=Streptomyces atratus TaxID=1893 RepID=UPI003661D709
MKLTIRLPQPPQLGGLTHRVFIGNDWAKLLKRKQTYGSARDREQVIPAGLGGPSRTR